MRASKVQHTECPKHKFMGKLLCATPLHIVPFCKGSVCCGSRKGWRVLVPVNKGTWPDVRDRVNLLLLGWSAYFSYGIRLQAYRASRRIASGST
jgi:hypothetical protein